MAIGIDSGKDIEPINSNPFRFFRIFLVRDGSRNVSRFFQDDLAQVRKAIGDENFLRENKAVRYNCQTVFAGFDGVYFQKPRRIGEIVRRNCRLGRVSDGEVRFAESGTYCVCGNAFFG